MQQTAPTGVLDAIWPVVAPALTPEIIGAIAVTLAATHAAKILAEAYWPDVTGRAARWRAFCASTSLAIGTVVGLVTWALTAATWPVVPIVAVGSGPIWRLLQALLPARVTDAFLTATDRRYRRKDTS